MSIISEIDCPHDATKIYYARIDVEINRIRYKKTIRSKSQFDDVYRDGSENEIDSYFMRNIRRKLELEKDGSESFKITNIEKLKYIGFTINKQQT